ncbi:LuxR C-terminal-related transcriptional regulator [Nocardia zapadnayensis]|nr:LuxR C-terminal-related transcriptional regulator [Nocardia zapadnayensis]MCX0272714.1 LuxR C-terminal-related transcriptional regulator [Nocardia zapadnayensis]
MLGGYTMIHVGDAPKVALNSMSATEGFVGRGPELDRISTLLLGSARLITLVGSGGIGKTRLATETVGRIRKAKRISVHNVRLARLSKGCGKAAVEEEVAAAVVGADFSDRSAWDAIVDTLTAPGPAGNPVPTVLVMDNCEHVLEEAGRFIVDLLEAVAGLTIVATSREAIGWVDEHVVVVPPLTRQQALALFRMRAELTGHFVGDREQLAMARLICRHVHNHPLYIRLAAARLLRQPLAMILHELSGEAADKRMRWSHGPRLGAEPRHRGVRDVISWSYDLCLEKERILLERMSVFAAGYDTNPEDETCSACDVGTDLEAIQVVCADDLSPEEGTRGEVVPSLAAEEIEDLLERLVDQCLVTLHITPTTVRYSLLESIRLFAVEQLARRSTDVVDEPARFARRHRLYYRDKIAAAQRNWFSPMEQEPPDWGYAAWDNILVAIETSRVSGEPAVGLSICTGLISVRAPVFKGSLRELRTWCERALQATRAQAREVTGLQIEAMALVAWAALCQGMHEDAEQLLENCAAACLRDPETRRSWRLSPETDRGLPAPLESVWGVELMTRHRDPIAITVLGRAREKYRNLGDRAGEARSELDEAMAASFLGSAPVALEITRRHLDRITASGARWARTWAEMAWAIALTRHGDPTEALTVVRAVLAQQLPLRDQWGAAMSVHIVEWSLARTLADLIAAGSSSRAELAARATEIAQLAGGATTLRGKLNIAIDLGPFDDETEKATDIARRVLGREAFVAAEKQGRLLQPELHEAQRLALGTLSIDKMPLDHPARKNAPSHWGELSAAEDQVAVLAAAGWTNSAIAARRGNSARTVDAHMAAIFRKLMITSRQDIVELVPADKVDQVRRETGRRPRRPR